MNNVLIYSEDAARGEQYADMIPEEDAQVVMVDSERALMEQLLTVAFRVAVIALDTFDHVDILGIVQKLRPRLPVVLITRNDSLEFEREARKERIFYLLVEPVDKKEFHAAIDNAMKYEKPSTSKNTSP